MHDDLLNAVSALVHRHVLDTLHALTGAMLAQLDAGGEVDLDGRAATPELAKPAIATPSPKPSTVERRARLVRAKQRQAAATAATGAAAPVTAEEDPWLALRGQFHAEIRRRHLTRGQIAAELGVSKGSICGWLLPSGEPPNADNIARIRAWLDQPAPKPEPPADDDWPALRERLKAVIAERALPLAAVGVALDVQAATVSTWIAKSHEDRAPGARAQIRIREWLDAGAVARAAAGLPPFVLSVEERAALAGHISLSNAPELRARFGATRELLGQAASGQHLAAEVIAKLRATLANGAAAE